MNGELQNINEEVISRDERLRLQFIQRNLLLNFFMDMRTFDLQNFFIKISEEHADNCPDDEGNYCNVCNFVDGRPDIINHIMPWCECGDKFSSHVMGRGLDNKCLVCLCPNYNELKMDIPLYRKVYSFGINSLNCIKCNKLNKEIIPIEKIKDYHWRNNKHKYTCSECEEEINV